MEENSIYLIKDLSRLSGLSVYTIKYYLKLGLVKEVSRSQGTNFRYFDNSTLEELNKIIALRREKVSLAKIKLILNEENISRPGRSM